MIEDVPGPPIGDESVPLMVGQPIGYVEPAPGEKLVLGVALADLESEPAQSLSSAMVGATQLSPMPFTGPGSGQIFTGIGQAPTPLTFARLTGLNCT
jgi:hypothetical protein